MAAEIRDSVKYTSGYASVIVHLEMVWLSVPRGIGGKKDTREKM
ncbi:hypothetical protein [Bacillus thuringiensis]|nr:hypothetical protein [Bacillus thuringiensis]